MLLKFFSTIRSKVAKRKTDCRRKHQRHDRVTLLTIQPLDEDFSPLSIPFWGMSRNISKGGIGFTCQQMPTGNYLRVTIHEDGESRIGIIRHILLVDEEANTFFIGLEFQDELHYGGCFG